MRSKNASGIITLAHCLSTNSEYPDDFLAVKHLKPIVEEYHSLIYHMEKYKDFLSPEIESLRPALARIRMHMVKNNLIIEGQENNEYA